MNKPIIFLIALIALVAACAPAPEAPTEDVASGDEVSDAQTSAWMDMELKDVRTGTKFKVSDFRGKPVLFESFAVWCPTCTKQQREVKKLHETRDDIITISVDTDPNEDESKVLEHVTRNGFDWLYAVAPVEMTRMLIDEFGVGIVNAPAVPMVLICEDGSTRFLKRGVRSPAKLEEEVAAGCA